MWWKDRNVQTPRGQIPPTFHIVLDKTNLFRLFFIPNSTTHFRLPSMPMCLLAFQSDDTNTTSSLKIYFKKVTFIANNRGFSSFNRASAVTCPLIFSKSSLSQSTVSNNDSFLCTGCPSRSETNSESKVVVNFK